ncbi:MAG: BolA/IbaG family iron-sulfur metabolism protein [Bdellovibrionales bacterium]|nr:BolA/IbaG family iron-sulfur metabolism protein [Bdellovibrionales bacterium]
MGPWEMVIREKLTSVLSPSHLELVNESASHGLKPEAEKHFRVIAVSEFFNDMSRIDRHRRVHEILAAELRDHVHALSVQAFTPVEWREKNGATFASPACLGGGKRESRVK